MNEESSRDCLFFARARTHKRTFSKNGFG